MKIRYIIFVIIILFSNKYLIADGLEILGEGALYYHQENTEGDIRNPLGGLNPEEIKKIHGYINPVFKYTYGTLIYSEVGLRLENPDFLKLSESGSMFNPDYNKASILHPPHLFLEKLRIKYDFFNHIDFSTGMWNYKELFFTPYTLHKWWDKEFFMNLKYGDLKFLGIHGANSNPYVTIADKISLMLPIREDDFMAGNLSYTYGNINKIGTTFVKQGSGKGNIVSINWEYVSKRNFFNIDTELAKENDNIAAYFDISKTIKNIEFKGGFFNIDKNYDASAGVDDKDFPNSWFPDKFSAGRVTFVDLNNNHEPDYPFDYNMERLSYIGIYINDVDPIVGDDINHNGIIDSVENDKYPEYRYKPDRKGFIVSAAFGNTNEFYNSSPNKTKKLYLSYKVRLKSQQSSLGSEQSFENFFNFYIKPISKMFIMSKVGFSILKDNIPDDTYYYNDYNLDGDLSEIEKKDWGMILTDAQNYIVYNNRFCDFDPIVFQNDYVGNISVKMSLLDLYGLNMDLRGENILDFDKDTHNKYSRIKARGKISYKIRFFKYFSLEPKYQIDYINDNLFYYQRVKTGEMSVATNIITDGVTTNYMYINTPDDEYMRSYYSEQHSWNSYLNSFNLRLVYSSYFYKPFKLIAEISYSMGKYYDGLTYVIGGRMGKLQSPFNLDFMFINENREYKISGNTASYSKIVVGLSRWINPY